MEITTKANIGDEIFFVSDNKVQTAEIKHIRIDIKETEEQFGTSTTMTAIYRTDKGNILYPNEFFKTKQELLDIL